MQLSGKQEEAISAIERWLPTKVQEFVVAGYAGTGKTTIAKFIAGNKEGVIFCAYTGKAANVLREKGCEPAGTIHGFLYSVSEREKKLIEELQLQLHNAVKQSDTKLLPPCLYRRRTPRLHYCRR